MDILQEGGHAVEGVTRINQANVQPTLQMIQSKILDKLGLELDKTAKILGSTGKRNPDDSSGDIDMAIAVDVVMKKFSLSDEKDAIEKIKEVVRTVTPDIVVNLGSGIINISYPIVNADKKQDKSKVQLDFMLVNSSDLDYVSYGYWSPAQWESQYKGALRSTLLMAIASEAKYKVLESQKNPQGETIPVLWERWILDPRRGLFKAKQTILSPKTGKIGKSKHTMDRELVSNNPEEITHLLLGPKASISDTNSFESILSFMRSPDFAHKSKIDQILRKVKREAQIQLNLSPSELQNIEIEEENITEAARTNVEHGTPHLEFLEDLVFKLGSDGIEIALDTVDKFISDLHKEGGAKRDLTYSSKIDGSPSLYFGKTPDGKFFVATKTIHNKKEQKLGYSLRDIQKKWSGDIANILSSAFMVLNKSVSENGVVLNGDLLFSRLDQKKSMEIGGQSYITFQPNTIMYAIPEDPKSEIYKKIKKANVGIVIHGAYHSEYEDERLVLSRLPTNDIITHVEKITNPSVFAIHPFMPHVDVTRAIGEDLSELQILADAAREEVDKIDPEFDQAWRDNTNPILRKIKKYMEPFAKSEAMKSKDSIYHAARSDEFAELFRKNLNVFLEQTIQKEASGLKTSVGKTKKMQELEELKDWLADYAETFAPFVSLYFIFYSIKTMILRSFDKIEQTLGKTFVVDRVKDTVIATKPEGYVLLNGYNMVKIVDRMEFTKNNIQFSPFADKDKQNTKTLVDEVCEEVLDKLDTMKNIYSKEHKMGDMVEATNDSSKYTAVYIGRFQPPTRAHVKNISDLSKIFKKVCIILSEAKNKNAKYLDKNPLSGETRKEILMSVPEIRKLKNVKIEPGSSAAIYGIYDPKQETYLRTLFDLKPNEVVVLALGKEDDRYHLLQNEPHFFDINERETPTPEKRFGLFGIDLQSDDSGEGKISATNIRNAIKNNKFDEAKMMMVGDDQLKDKAIAEIRRTWEEKSKRQKIEELNVEPEIIESIGNEYKISEEKAIDLFLDIIGA